MGAYERPVVVSETAGFACYAHDLGMRVLVVYKSASASKIRIVSETTEFELF